MCFRVFLSVSKTAYLGLLLTSYVARCFRLFLRATVKLLSNRVSLPFLSEATAILSGGALQALHKKHPFEANICTGWISAPIFEDEGAGAKCSKGPPTPSSLLRIGVGGGLLPRRLFDKTKGGWKEGNK